MTNRKKLKYIAGGIIVAAIVFGAGYHWAAKSAKYAFHFNDLLNSYPIGNKKANVTSLFSQKNATVNFIQFYGDIKPHIHKKHAEIVISLSDGGTIKIAGKKYPLKKGSLFFIPKKTVHEAQCNGEKICNAYSIFLPKWNPKKPDRVRVD